MENIINDPALVTPTLASPTLSNPTPVNPTPVNPTPAGSSVLGIDKDGHVNTQLIPAEQRANYDALAQQLNESDPNSVINFGSDIQKNISGQSDNFLNSVRNHQAGEVGNHINELLTELSYIDVDELNQSGFTKFLSSIPFVKNMIASVEKIFIKYDKVTANVDKIGLKVKSGMINSAKDNAVLQHMFETNLQQIQQMEQYIVAGTLKFEQAGQELALMQANPSQYPDYQVGDKRDFINRLDRRLADMKIVRYIMIQSLAQIRIIQSNNNSIAEKAQSILTTTLPVWKNQLTLAVALQRQKQNVEVQKRVADTTNTILQKNAELLKQNSIEVAQQSENTIVSLDTLRNTTKSLIDTLNEVKQIHQQGADNRRQLDAGLQSLEQELKKSITH